MHQFIFATKFRGLITWPDIQLVHNYTPIDLKDRISGRTPHTPAFLNNGTSMLSHNMFSTPFQLHRPVTDKATKIKRDKPYILNFDLHAQFYHPLVKRVRDFSCQAWCHRHVVYNGLVKPTETRQYERMPFIVSLDGPVHFVKKIKSSVVDFKPCHKIPIKEYMLNRSSMSWTEEAWDYALTFRGLTCFQRLH